MSANAREAVQALLGKVAYLKVHGIERWIRSRLAMHAGTEATADEVEKSREDHRHAHAFLLRAYRIAFFCTSERDTPIPEVRDENSS
jgi:hypothetical protein